MEIFKMLAAVIIGVALIVAFSYLAPDFILLILVVVIGFLIYQRFASGGGH